MTGHKMLGTGTIPKMQHASENDDGDTAGASSRFWLLLFDNLFRRSALYLLPVLLMAGIGVLLAQRSSVEYASTATLDASNNPLVENVDIRGNDPLFRQTTAQSTANFIGEQLRTDVFVADVAERAGLTRAIETGFLRNSTVRRAISARANGDSLILISAQWTDPTTAQLLVNATIDTYRAYVVETVADDSFAAEEFYTELQTRAREQADSAQEELDAYVATLPPIRQDEERTIEQQLTIQRLNNKLERAETNVETAAGAIEAAQLEVAKSRSEAGLSIRVIDPAEVPSQSEPWLFQAVSIIVTFTILGILISATALIITTALDRTVRFVPDVIAHTESPYVTSVPVMSSIRERSKRAAASMAIDSPSTDNRSISAGDDEPNARGGRPDLGKRGEVVDVGDHDATDDDEDATRDDVDEATDGRDHEVDDDDDHFAETRTRR